MPRTEYTRFASSDRRRAAARLASLTRTGGSEAEIRGARAHLAALRLSEDARRFAEDFSPEDRALVLAAMTIQQEEVVK